MSLLWLLACASTRTEYDVGEACWDGDHARVFYGCLDACYELVDVTCWLYQTDDAVQVSTEWEIVASDERCGDTCVELFISCETMWLVGEPYEITLIYGEDDDKTLAQAACPAI